MKVLTTKVHFAEMWGCEYEVPLNLFPVSISGVKKIRIVNRLLPAGHRRRGDVGI